MKLRCTLIAVFFLALSAAFLPAQTAAELERILDLPAVSYHDAAWVILLSAGAVPPQTSADDAYDFAADNKWLPKKAAADAPVTLGGVSLLIMQSLNLKGGLMFSLFPNPRYGYRELVYRKRLSRSPETYTSTVPPQVKVARALGWKKRRGTVEYIWTVNGPEPVALPHEKPDYDHYADSQVFPVARSIAAAARWDTDFFVKEGEIAEGQMELGFTPQRIETLTNLT